MEQEFGPPRVTYLIARLDRGIRVLIDEAVRRHGLSTPQYTAMSVIARRAGLSSAQLARRAFVTPQAMHSIVAELTAAGLVERTPSPSHAKVLHTELSPRGRMLFEACDADVDAIEQQLLSAISAVELDELRASLSALVTRLSMQNAPPSAQGAGWGRRRSVRGRHPGPEAPPRQSGQATSAHADAYWDT